MNTTRRDVLFSRVVDREAEPADWCELDQLAAGDAASWQELLDALRHDAAVRLALAPVLAAADRSALQLAPAARRRRRLAFNPGWAAAVLIAGLWLVTALARAPAGADPVAAQASRAGDRGSPTVLGELSRVVVRARPTGGGDALEVVYVRRVLERCVLDELYQITEDEHGMPVPAPVDLARFEAPSSY